MASRSMLAAFACMLLLTARGTGQQPMPTAHFHQVHLTTTDSARAIEFFSEVFGAERMNYLGRADQAPHIWAGHSWILLSRAMDPPPFEPISALWKVGFGAADVRAAYQRQVGLGRAFLAPPGDASASTGTSNTLSAALESPDKLIVEMRTANHNRFDHVQLLSEDPMAAAMWYIKYFSAKRPSGRPFSRELRMRDGSVIGPVVSIVVDDVDITITPAEYSRRTYPEAWKGHATLVPSKGRVIDHMGFTFDDIDITAAVERLRSEGIRVIEEVRWCCGRGTFQKVAFVEGPDNSRIELLEGRATRP